MAAAITIQPRLSKSSNDETFKSNSLRISTTRNHHHLNLSFFHFPCPLPIFPNSHVFISFRSSTLDIAAPWFPFSVLQCDATLTSTSSIGQTLSLLKNNKIPVAWEATIRCQALNALKRPQPSNKCQNAGTVWKSSILEMRVGIFNIADVYLKEGKAKNVQRRNSLFELL